MKVILYLAVMLISLSAAASNPPEINEKVLAAFNATFSDAKDVNWSESEDQCEAHFKLSEVRLRAVYDIEGNLLQTFRSYTEKHLPAHILARVKKTYPGQEVFVVTELISESEISYEIVLKDATHWYKLKSDPYANLQLTQKFRRASEG